MPNQPQQIGRYEIIEPIGRGGMATVYRARDPKLRREVALKIIVPQLSVDRTFVQRFQREARLVAQVDHPQIVAIYDSGEYEGRPFLVMRLLSGGTLREKINQGPLPVDTVTTILRQIGDALHAAHRKGIVHRDIKPSNILFDEPGSAFVSDFGIAKMVDSHTNLTGTRMVGTPVYMSPEQFQGRVIDGRTDQYSLAVVAYEALSGRPPFEGEMMTLAYKHVNEPVPPLLEIAGHVPQPLAAALERALSKRPSDRFPDLSLMINSIGQPAAPPPVPPVTPPIDGWAGRTTTEAAGANALAEMYNEGVAALAAGKYAAARQLLSRVFKEDPRYLDIGQKLHEAEVALATQMRFQGASSTARPPVTLEATLPLPPAVPQSKPRWPLFAALGVLFLLLLAGGGYGYSAGWFDQAAEMTPTAEALAAVIPSDTPVPPATEVPPTPTPSPPPPTATATAPPATATSLATPTTTPAAPTPAPTAVPSATIAPTPVPTATQGGGPVSSGDGFPLTFDGAAFGTWVRGDEANGTLTQAAGIARSGQAARLDYEFNTPFNDYVVFLQNNLMSGEPTQIKVWVYGDGSGHFLNAWILDGDGQTWQVPFGRITHSGWQQMTGTLDPSQDWPWTHISGPENDEVEYPVTLRGFVLDDLNDAYTGSGTIYLDDVSISSGAIAKGPTVTPAPTLPAGVTPTATPNGGGTFTGEIGRILYTSGTTILTTDPTWSSPKEIGTAVQTTCSGTPSTADGTTFSVSRGFYCGLTEGTSVCKAPNGAVEVIFNGNYNSGFALTIRPVGANTGGDYIFDSKDFDLAEGLRWSPDSSSFLFVLGDTVYTGFTDRSYRPLFSPAYNPIFSPDGSQILYRKPIGPGVNDVFVADASGENQRNVTNIATIDKSCAVWVP